MSKNYNLKLTISKCTKKIKVKEIHHFNKKEDRIFNHLNNLREDNKVNIHIPNLVKEDHHNLPILKINNYKLEDGNGHILLFKELVLVQEEDIVLLYQVLQSLFLVVITIPEKLKAILILTIHMFLMLMLINLQ